MASDVVSPLSVRVSASLATARIVLFTLGKLLLLFALVAVLDACNAWALADMAYSCFLLVTDILSFPTTLAFFDQLLHTLFSHTPPFLRIDLYHIASQVWDEIEPCIPPPPIQFYVLGKGIQCGSDPARRPATEAISDLASRLVCHLVDFAWSLGISFTDRISILLSSYSFWCYLLSLFAFFCLLSLWMLYSASRSLDDYPLEPLDSINAKVIHASSKIRSLWCRLRKQVLHAIVFVQIVHVCWPSQLLRASCFYEVEFHNSYTLDRTNAVYFRKDLAHYLYERLVRSVLNPQVVRFAPSAAALFCFASMVVSVHVVFLFYSIWHTFFAWKLARFEDILRTPTFPTLQHPCTHDHIVVPAVRPLTIVPDVPALSDVLLPSVNEPAAHPPNCRRFLRRQVIPTLARKFSGFFSKNYYVHPGLFLKYSLGIDGELGVGGNGFVLHGRRNRDCLEVAIKVVQRTERSMRRWPVHPKYGQVPNDVIVMEALDHDNISRMLDVFTDDQYVYIVQELFGTPWAVPWTISSDEDQDLVHHEEVDSTLHGYLKKHHHMSAKDASYVFTQLVSAIEYLHSKGFVHCDIKPGNILIDADLKVKLIDFGNVITIPTDRDPSLGELWYDDLRLVLGTRLYMAPEIFFGESYIPQALDVWALGVTLFEMLAGYRPFPDVDSITRGDIKYELDELVNMEGLAEMWVLVEGCLDTYPARRLTIELLKDPRKIELCPHWKVDVSPVVLENFRKAMSL